MNELQKKYPHLEINILSLSQVYDDNESGRIDSEYFKREFLKNEELIGKNFVYLSSISEKICSGSTPPNGLFDMEGIPFFRSQDFNILDAEPKQYISRKFHKILERSQVKNDDILIAIVGATLGQIGIVNNIDEANINQNVARIRIVNQEFDPYFIAVFLSSYYGQYQISRLATRTAQEFLNNTLLGKLKVPKIPMAFQLEIRELVFKSYSALKQSKLLYKEAQDVLYTELGLDPNNPLGEIEKEEENLSISIQTLQESYAQTGRLDAEYYQAKYETIEKILYRFQTTKLKDLVIYPISSGSTPKAGEENYTNSTDGIRFLRVVDIKNGQIDEDSNFLYIKDKVHTEMLKRTRLIKGDILFSIAGTIGRCALFNHDFEANINQALVLLRFSETKDIRKLYLVAFFNSSIGQVYLEKYARQGVQTNLNLDEVRNLIVPKISLEIQEKIANKIQDGFNLQTKAKNLLKEAIAQVEAKISAQV